MDELGTSSTACDLHLSQQWKYWYRRWTSNTLLWYYFLYLQGDEDEYVEKNMLVSGDRTVWQAVVRTWKSEFYNPDQSDDYLYYDTVNVIPEKKVQYQMHTDETAVKVSVGVMIKDAGELDGQRGVNLWRA